MKYRLLNISKVPESNKKIDAICNDLDIVKIESSDLMDGLEKLMEASVNIIVISIDTNIDEENLLKFLEMLSSDIENINTPILIISELDDNESILTNISAYNIISIFTHKSWPFQLKRLLENLMLQSSNIHELSGELEQSNHVNIRDALTGALNRYGAEDSFINLTSRHIAYEENFSLIMLDIDHFKKVNDTYGHDIGDEVIISLANSIKNTIRSTDKFVRFGGEEFLIMLSDTNLSDAIEIAEKIRITIQNDLHSSKKLKITSSFGVVMYKNKDSLNNLVKKADLLLYEAKKSGRNIVKFKSDDNIDVHYSETLHEIKKDRDVLIRSNILLNQYYDAVNDCSLVSKTDKDGIINFANDKFIQISGYKEEELIGKQHNILRDPAVNSDVFKDLWATIKSKKMWNGRISNKRKDGSIYIVDTYVYPILGDKDIITEYISIRHVLEE